MNEPVMTIVNENGVFMTHKIGPMTMFCGVASNTSIKAPQSLERLVNLLIRAFNNRTRERNYFKLYSEMLEGDISEEYFNKEIEENSDKYVVPAGEESEPQDVYLALSVSPQMKCIESSDDFISIFSFNDNAVMQLIGQ